MLSPYQLDDKTYVEFHGSPKWKVTLFYALDTGLGAEPEYKNEPLYDIYEGIRTKSFTLFYGETLHYYFQSEYKGKIKKTAERTMTMSRVEGAPGSKYQMINQILSAIPGWTRNKVSRRYGYCGKQRGFERANEY